MLKNTNQLKVGVFLSYISKVIKIIVGLLYTPIMIRLLGQSEYGLYNIAASTIAYLGVLNFGLGSSYIRFYSRYQAKKEADNVAKLNGMVLGLFTILGIVVVIAGIVLAFNVELIFGPSLSLNELRTASILILILVLNLAVSFPNIVFNNYIQANEKFIFQNVIQIARQVTTPFVTLPLLIAGLGSIGMVSGMVTVNIILEIIIIIYCLKNLNMKFRFNNFDFELLTEMTIYSTFIFINMIVNQVNDSMDNTILGRYQGTTAVAVYSVASSLKLYYAQLSTTFLAMLTPRVHKMVEDKISDTEMTHFFTRIGRVQFIILSIVISGFVFFGRPFIGIWAGQNYYDSYFVGIVLMLPYTIDLIQNTSIEIQRAKNLHKVRSVVYLLMAGINLSLSIPLSIRFGAMGAAIGTGLSYILGNGIFMNIYNHYRVGLNMKYFWKKITEFAPAFIIPVLYGIGVNYFFNLYNIFNLLIFGAIYVLISVLSMWFIGMNEYEKKLFKNPFR